MNRFDFYENWHKSELEKKNDLPSKISLPIGLITTGIVVLFYYFTNFDFQHEQNKTVKILFLLGCIFTFIALCSAIFYTAKSLSNTFSGFKYQDLAYSTEIENHYDNLLQYYKENTAYFEGNPEDNAKEAFNEDIKVKLIESIRTNASINDERYDSLYIANIALVAVISSLFFTLFPFGFNFINKPEKIQVVKIENQMNGLENNLTKIHVSLDSINSTLDRKFNLNVNEKRLKTTISSETTPKSGSKRRKTKVSKEDSNN